VEQAPYYDPSANWSLVPSHMRGAVERYVMHGISPGNFLTAVLSNDLKEAFARADDDNAAAMHGWVRFLYNYTPSNSHGSPATFRAWIERGGLVGNEVAA
jgi:hypothetical protein